MRIICFLGFFLMLGLGLLAADMTDTYLAWAGAAALLSGAAVCDSIHQAQRKQHSELKKIADALNGATIE